MQKQPPAIAPRHSLHARRRLDTAARGSCARRLLGCRSAAPDPSQLRPTTEQEAIWAAYEALVAYAAAHLDVVTSGDLVHLAAALPSAS